MVREETPELHRAAEVPPSPLGLLSGVLKAPGFDSPLLSPIKKGAMMPTKREILARLDYGCAMDKARDSVAAYEQGRLRYAVDDDINSTPKGLTARMVRGGMTEADRVYLKRLCKYGGWYRDPEGRKSEKRFQRKLIKHHMRPASAQELAAFVIGYLEREEEPQLNYHPDMNMNARFTETIYILHKNILLPAYCGSWQLSIIVPSGIKVSAPYGYGHNSLYFMEDFTFHGPRRVPVYRDVEECIRRLCGREL